MIDLARAFYIKSMVTAAARQGARVAAVTADPTSGGGYTAVRTRVSNVIQYAGLDSFSVTVSQLGNPLDRDQVQVNGSFHWVFFGLFNHFGASTITNPQQLTATAVAAIE